MKRGIIIGIVIVIVLIVGLSIYFGSVNKDKRSGILETLKPSWEFIFLDKTIGKGYGECIVDSDCGYPLRIEGERKCGGSNIVQEVTQKMCDVGKCVERISSQIIGRAPICSACDYSSGEPQFVPVEEGTSCYDESGNKGFCFEGKCEKDDCNSEKYKKLLEGKGSCFTCGIVDGKPRFFEKENGAECNDEFGNKGACFGGECESVNACGGSYCMTGEECCGGGTSFPLCCNSKTEFCDSNTNLINLDLIDRRLTKAGIERWKALKILELSKKYNLDSLSKDSMAKLRRLDSEKDILIELIKQGVTNPLKFLEFYKKLEEKGIGPEEYSHMISGLNFFREINENGISDLERDTILNIYTEEASNPSDKSYFCQKKESECEKDGKHKLCLGSHGSACCPISGPGSACISYTSSIYDLRNNWLDSLRNMFKKENIPIYNPELTIGACGDQDSVSEDEERKLNLEQIEQKRKSYCLSQGKKYCADKNFGKVSNGVICCELEEDCITGNIYGSPTAILWTFFPPFCQPSSCGKGFTECSATISASGGQVHRLCCNDAVEECVDGIRSYIRCWPNPKKAGNPSSTQSTSVYMIRNENEFSLDGKAYVISPHIEFEKEIRVTLSDEIKDGEDVFKYKEHEAVLENCDIEELERVSETIRATGGIISLEGISLNIPSEALAEEVKFTIIYYELSNCYEVGKSLYVGYPENEKEPEGTPYETNVLNFWVIGTVIGIIILILVILFRKKVSFLKNLFK